MECETIYVSILVISSSNHTQPKKNLLTDVMDLATGHVAAMKKLEKGRFGIKFYNLGTGQGVSVLSLIKTFERVNNVKVPYVIQPRREGDISTMYADPTLAENELNWKAVHSLEEMCRDFWRWQTMNPDGYKTEQKTNGHSNGH